MKHIHFGILGAAWLLAAACNPEPVPSPRAPDEAPPGGAPTAGGQPTPAAQPTPAQPTPAPSARPTSKAGECHSDDDCGKLYGVSDEGPPHCCANACVDCFVDDDDDGIWNCRDKDLGCEGADDRGECETDAECGQGATCCKHRCVDQPCS